MFRMADKPTRAHVQIATKRHRLFPDLPAWEPALGERPSEREVEAHFLKIACEEMIGESRESAIPQFGMKDKNASIPSGYTFFLSFIGNDLSHPSASKEISHPHLNLGCLYGRGPGANPFLYDRDRPAQLLLSPVDKTSGHDLPRNGQGTAIIADPRNDANAVLSGLHTVFAQAHNALVDRAIALSHADPFTAARTTLTWLYQHVVWHDCLGRLTQPEIHSRALQLEPQRDGRSVWKSEFDRLFNGQRSGLMPIELCRAVYLFHHAMFDAAYLTNPERGADCPIALFQTDGEDLRGGRSLPRQNVVDWSWFFSLRQRDGRFSEPQIARRIGPTLDRALAALPDPDGLERILAYRNLVSGWRIGLPSGSAVAAHLGFEPAMISQDHDSLWLYTLTEAKRAGGTRLGPVASLILCASFSGFLSTDPEGFVMRQPLWTPDRDPLLRPEDNRDSPADHWTLASIVRLARGRSGERNHAHAH